jgi:anti-sigma factor RsiW
MKLTSEEMLKHYQRQTARSVAGRADCLLEDLMKRAAVGELSQPERERIADHLVVCSDCSQEYRLLRRITPLAGRAAVSSESEIDPEMAEINERVQYVKTPPGLPRRLNDIFSTGLRAYATATLLVISLACVAWVISLRRENLRMSARLEEQLSMRDQTSQSLAETRRQLEEITRRAEERQNEIAKLSRSVDELSQPQFNAPITDLESQNMRSGAQNAVAIVTMPVRVNLFMLILHVSDKQTFPEYALEILDRQGRRVWRAQGLRRSQADTFTVAMQRRLLPAGQYRIRLYGQETGRSETIGDYAIRVRYQPEKRK